jgi:hypothetical protein
MVAGWSGTGIPGASVGNSLEAPPPPEVLVVMWVGMESAFDGGKPIAGL